MKIKTGSRILTGAIAFGIVCVVAINAYGVILIDMERQADAVSREISDTVFDLNILANEMSLRRSARVSTQFRQRLDRLEGSLANLAEIQDTSSTVVARMKRSARGLEITFNRLMQLDASRPDDAQALAKTGALIQSFLSASQTLADLARRQSAISGQLIEEIETNVKLMSIATLAATVLILSVTYFYIVGSVLNPIVALHNKVTGIEPLAETGDDAERNSNEIEAISQELDDRMQVIHAKEQELARQASELKRSNDDLEEFAYIASHDMKEPIRAISNHAQFLAEDHGELLGDAGAQRINRIRALCEKSERSISDLLEFSRIGRLEAKSEPLDLTKIIDDIRDALSDYLTERNGTVVINGELPMASGDPARVESVFRNLIVNGIKYNDSVEKRVEIGYRPGSVGKLGKFYVKDNGIGIPERHREKVFTIFKRLHNDKTYGGGTGAGLSIVRKIIEQNGGQISLKSVENEGSEFSFNLMEVRR